MTMYWGHDTARDMLNLFFRGQAVAPVAQLYVALFVADPGPDGTGSTEIAGTGYARQMVSFSAPASTGDPGTISNVSTVAFPSAGSDWGLVAGGAIFTAASGGKLVAHGPLATARTVLTGDVMRFPTGSITAQAAAA